jgi:hydroxymethylpyrimidine/phosphomethylpyrimidine kinase
MCALGVYGMSVITAVTAQNTQAVYAVQEIDAGIVAKQIDAVFEDIRVDAVKIGMVSSTELIRTIREGLLRHRARNIVLDPVMVSKSGCRLLREDAMAAILELATIADIITPNIPEAEILAGFRIETEAGMQRAAERIAESGVKNVLVKGGHRLGSDAADLLYSGGTFLWFQTRRIDTKHTHGTGCTLSSAIASRLALGDTPHEAVQAAKDYITQAIADAYALGKGTGPVGHLAALYRKAGMGECQTQDSPAPISNNPISNNPISNNTEGR